MASGRQIAEENVQAFVTWLASKTDDDFRAMTSRGVLSRKEIATECGFAKSSLDQNPRIKASLGELEDALRARGVLPHAVEKTAGEAAKPLMREPGKLRGALDAERLCRLETDNASFKAEVAELKRTLEKHAILSEALALTGRLPC
ncbi:MAG: VPA1267 family protein [Polaromonas sp.]|nr:VPA1267 family protein [Polaromonas sp.]MDP3413233.1 VPA1267 family protein [Polaromonas sp.]MDP3606177.1 VPA1267 family protein [Polaromonas sp.]